MSCEEHDFLLFGGSSNPSLTKAVADHLGMPLNQVKSERFPDGEISVQIMDNVRGHDVFVIQTVALNPNDYLMELLIIVDSLKRASARSIAAVIPYFGYCRQDRKDRPRAPITAKLVANLLVNAGVSKVLTMDLHTEQLQGFFDIPVDNLYGGALLTEAFRKDFGTENLVVVTPDIGSIKLAKAYAKTLNLDFAIIDKHRRDPSHVEVISLIGDVKGKNVLLADDMCSTGDTLVSAAKVCQEKGAKRIFATVTHGLFVHEAIEKIEQSPIEVIYTTDTVPCIGRIVDVSKIRIVSAAPLFAQAMRCMESRESISSLFRR